MSVRPAAGPLKGGDLSGSCLTGPGQHPPATPCPRLDRAHRGSTAAGEAEVRAAVPPGGASQSGGSAASANGTTSSASQLSGAQSAIPPSCARATSWAAARSAATRSAATRNSTRSAP